MPKIREININLTHQKHTLEPVQDEATQLFDAGERDARSGVSPTQPHNAKYMVGYEDGLYQKEIGYSEDKSAISNSH